MKKGHRIGNGLLCLLIVYIGALVAIFTLVFEIITKNSQVCLLVSLQSDTKANWVHNTISIQQQQCIQSNFLTSMTSNLTNLHVVIEVLKRNAKIIANINKEQGQNLTFVHINIPKTGGSTIEDISKQYGYQWGRWNNIFNKKLYSYKQFGGRKIVNCHSWHIPPYLTYNFGVFNQSEQHISYSNEKMYETFCVVRNPFTRMISEYNYQRGCSHRTDINRFLQNAINAFYFDKNIAMMIVILYHITVKV